MAGGASLYLGLDNLSRPPKATVGVTWQKTGCILFSHTSGHRCHATPYGLAVQLAHRIVGKAHHHVQVIISPTAKVACLSALCPVAPDWSLGLAWLGRAGHIQLQWYFAAAACKPPCRCHCAHHCKRESARRLSSCRGPCTPNQRSASPSLPLLPIRAVRGWHLTIGAGQHKSPRLYLCVRRSCLSLYVCVKRRGTGQMCTRLGLVCT